MPHQLSQYVSKLPTVEEWLAGDDRVLAFQVVDDAGNGVDISNATVEWELYDRPYNDDPANAELTGDDAGVTLETTTGVDASNGEWEVQVDGSASEGIWGTYYQRAIVTQSDGTVASWRGKVIITA